MSTTTETRTVSGTGLATFSNGGDLLDVWYPNPVLGSTPPEASEVLEDLDGTIDSLRHVRREIVRATIDLDSPVDGIADAYLRLHALSHLLVAPNKLNLDGLIPTLPNNAWTSAGPVQPAVLDEIRPLLRAQGITIHGIDKFPRLLDYVSPKQVRIADGARVRLGAHLSPGTVVMHAGFVNFNAGTLGTSMVEGRISQGVVVADGADVGGGASIMGTLSGGGKERISIGERALLGANSGVGISIGTDSVVEAGLYVTAGTKVTVASTGGSQIVKARELSGTPNILFRRNSVTGVTEAVPRAGTGITLNSQLHQN